MSLSDHPATSANGPKRQFLRRNHTSEVGGEADMPRQLDRRVMTRSDIRPDRRLSPLAVQSQKVIDFKCCSRRALRGAHAAARVHHASWRNGCDVVAGGACSATSPAGGRVFRRRFTQFDNRRTCACIPPGIKRNRLCRRSDLVVEYRWTEGHNDRLSAFASDLVRRQVAVIVAITTPSVLAAKEATATIPIVFFVAGDPVELGCCQPEPTRRQPHGYDYFNVGGCVEMARAVA